MSDDGKSHDPPYVAVASPSAARNSSSVPDRNSDTPFGDTSQPVSLRKLFSYADSFDLMLILVGTLASLVAGVAQPIQIILLGDVVNSFNPTNPVTKEKFRADINSVSLQFAIAGVVMIACGFIQATAWSMTASRQVKRIREAFARAILAKDIGWYDVNDPMKLSTKMVESSFLIEGGMGTKIGDGLNNIALAVSGIIIGLVKGWKLALVVLAATPILAIAAGISVKMIGRATKLSVESYAEAGAIAQESLSNIRTVHMFNAFEHFLGKYKAALVPATKAGIFKGLASGLGSGFMFFTSFCTYAGGLYYGAVLIANDRRDGCVEDCFNGGRVLTIFYCVMLGSLGFGHAAPSLQALGSARVAAADVFAVIDEPSKIDTLNDDGVVPDSVRGYIRFQNVSFAYPSRPKVMVCRNYSLDIQPGETVALVGPSGSGKSTVVALIERFYNPKDGSVTLDGVDIRTVNLRWLRQQIGLVAQEPTLFATTIMENIRYGKPGATDDEVIEAAKMANAYSFIQDFPQGFLTDVGQRGTQLSGGQKQRIAIARAIIKNPPIMILDEATSALDVESEAVVQESLDRLVLTSKRTTIIIAHRLSTIRYANKIAVHSAGAIVELGTHEQLMKINGGHYRQLVEGQHSSKHCDTKEDTTSSCDTLDHTDSADLMNEATTHSDTRGENANANENHDNNPPALSIGRVWAMSLEDWRFMLLGCIGAILNACTFPVWGFLLTKMTVLFFEEIPRDDFLHKATNWSLGFFGLALVFGCSSVAQQYGFAVTAQKLIARVRSAVYAAMLRQEVGWFDKEENSPSGLVSRLAVDSALVHATTSDILNRLLVVVTTLAITFGISFFHSWEMTLVVLATGPVLIIVGKVRAEVMNGTQGDQKSRDSDASLGATLGEAITSIRTVVSYCLEDEIRSKYHTLLHANQSAERLRAIVGGVTFGISIGARFFVLALLFYVGGIWVAGGRITFEDMFMVIFVIMLGMFAVSMTSQGAQDPTKAKHAASRLFAIIDRTPTIDAASSTGIQLDQVVGDIVFHDVAFSYPTRPNAPIYTQYNLRVKAGQTVALVGASGSGKSTAIALLERFYDPSAGVITLDGHDLRSLSLPWLRRSVSLVSQEPVLFSGSIADNIALGNAGASREEVIEAAKKANAFDFINNFPDGFDTGIGSDGSQVSGGQKQRIAIARAILRDPSVLLLDEATSALDNESERVVQASLDELLATRRRTTIIVAHRLSTIRNADLIAVTQNGVIIEQGTHSELMSIDEGIYKALVMRQM